MTDESQTPKDAEEEGTSTIYGTDPGSEAGEVEGQPDPELVTGNEEPEEDENASIYHEHGDDGSGS
jgi:hypothetical protein